MQTHPQKPRSIAHESQALPKGRIVTLGASTRRRERLLLTSLSTVSLALIALLGTEAWMFHKGTLAFIKSPEPAVMTMLPPTAKVAPPLPDKVTSGKSSPRQHTQTVTATMAPTPASGKFEDIILPIDKSAVTDTGIKAEAKSPALAQTAPSASTAQPAAPATPKLSATPPAKKLVVIASVPQPVAVTPTPAPAPVPVKKLVVVALAPQPVVAAPSPAPAPVPAPVAAPAAAPAPASVSVQAKKPNPALEEAQADLDKGDYAGALVIYDRLLDLNSKNAGALAGKAYVLQHTEQYEAAIDLDHQLLKLNPKDKDAHTNLITTLGQASTPSAQSQLQSIVAADPENALAEATLAKVLVHRGSSEQALAHLKRAVDLDPSNVTYRLDLAILYDRSGHGAEALALYQQVLQDGGSKQLPLSVNAIQTRVDALQHP